MAKTGKTTTPGQAVHWQEYTCNLERGRMQLHAIHCIYKEVPRSEHKEGNFNNEARAIEKEAWDTAISKYDYIDKVNKLGKKVGEKRLSKLPASKKVGFKRGVNTRGLNKYGLPIDPKASSSKSSSGSSSSSGK